MKSGRQSKDYRTLIERVTNYVLTINSDFQITLCNDLVRENFPMAFGQTCYQTWKDRKTPCPECPVKECFDTREAVVSEEAMILKDGREICFEVKATPVKNSLGEVISVILVATDVNRSRQLTGELGLFDFRLDEHLAQRIETLQASEKKYRTIFEHSLDMILLLDSDLNILDINLAGLKLLNGRRKEEIIGRTSLRDYFFKPDDFSRFMALLHSRGVVQDIEILLTSGNADPFPVLISAHAISDRDGQLTYYEITARDIFLLRINEENLKERDRQLSIINEILQTLSQSLLLNPILEQVADQLMASLQGNSFRIYLLDERKETLHLAVTRGLSDRFLNKPFIQQRPLNQGLLGRSAQTCRTIVVENFKDIESQYQEDLDLEELRSAAYIPLSTKGNLVGVLGVTSSQKNKFTPQDEKFLDAFGHSIGMVIENAHLFYQTRQAYKELQVAQEHILHREKLASLGKLAATIAHEINNPISSILTYSKLLRRVLGNPSFNPNRIPDLQRYLKTMETETARCGEIVKNLLDFSRQTTPKKEWVHLDAVVEKTMALLAHNLKLKSIHLVHRVDSSLPRISCDVKQLQQVFVNLLVNAAEAMPQGGQISIEGSYDSSEDRVVYRIQDTGVGITSEHLPKIFEPFFTTKDEIKGVGLGLSVVHGIIEEHGGVITVESNPGEGTCFCIKLPMDNPELSSNRAEIRMS